MSKDKRVWLITGVSGGFGRALAELVAKEGDTVYGTLRKDKQFAAFEALVPGHSFPVLMDVTNQAQVNAGVEEVLKKEGRIDVLVNNAGYGLFGAIEEVTMEEARQQMETNFFGALMLTKAVLPSMREHKKGNILQISSMAGMTTSPGLGIYNASKHALEGFSGALAQEVAEFNIKVTIIEPGPFRTDWAGSSSVDSANAIQDYHNSAGKLKNVIHGYSGQQPGDPKKAAHAMLEVVNSKNPPLHLPLGNSAYTRIKSNMADLAKELETWGKVGKETDYEQKQD